MIAEDLTALAVPVSKLSTLPGNPRRGDVDAIARSLDTFGQRKPIVARSDGTVVAGNHTLAAAQRLGWDEIAVVWVDDDEATGQAFALADNRTAELGGYDDAALSEMLEAVHDADEELFAATSWTDDEREDLLARLAPEPERPVAPRTYPHATGAAVLRGDALSVPLRAGSVDLVISSPPYFALRSYRDDGEHYDGQLGSEETPAAFLANLWAVMDECWRVLAPTGSAWINLGDKYAGGSARSGAPTPFNERARGGIGSDAYVPDADVPDKSLMGLPWRFALGLICPDQYRPGGGPQWTLRAEVIWDKPNGLPESVTDRVRRSHEQWFHLVKGERYFAGLDDVREKYVVPNHNAVGTVSASQRRREHAPDDETRTGYYAIRTEHPLVKLPGSVWSIPSQPLTVPDDLGVDHFAAFPAEWPRRIIDGWSTTGVCVVCGEARVPVVDRRFEIDQVQNNNRSGRMDMSDRFAGPTENNGVHGRTRVVGSATATITGYRCACETPDAPIRPAIILDPFGGTGTVAMMARAMGRYGVHLDLSRDYNRLACWRIFESGGGARCLAKAEEVDA